MNDTTKTILLES